jgi:hypothetical protein
MEVGSYYKISSKFEDGSESTADIPCDFFDHRNENGWPTLQDALYRAVAEYENML